jgi:hypothetical protein
VSLRIKHTRKHEMDTQDSKGGRVNKAKIPSHIQIPRDTLGNALPFPVPSGKICRMKPEEWERMWIQEALGTLPKEVDCSICGDYFPSKEIFPLDRQLMHPNIQRQALNTTLQNTRICRGCKAHCSKCKKIVPRAQKKRTNDMCQPCADEERLAPRARRR